MKREFPEITPQELADQMKDFHLIDVRTKEEFFGELAHIPGSYLKVQGPELSEHLKTLDPKTPLVFVCRSGNRSGHATLEALSLGFQTAYNMSGGMLLWNQLGLPTSSQD